MKNLTLFFSLIIFSSSIVVSSQTLEKSTTPIYLKNQIGLQLNPFLYDGTIYEIIYGFRYGYRISKPVTLGAEISGAFPAPNNSMFPFTDFKAGAFARYTFRPEKRIQIFLETSPFYAYTYVRRSQQQGYDSDLEWSNFGIYIAPGLSLLTKNRKFSLDLYYKLYIHRGYYAEGGQLFSYKVNFHF
jgi:hypothetical protein